MENWYEGRSVSSDGQFAATNKQTRTRQFDQQNRRARRRWLVPVTTPDG